MREVKSEVFASQTSRHAISITSRSAHTRAERGDDIDASSHRGRRIIAFPSKAGLRHDRRSKGPEYHVSMRDFLHLIWDKRDAQPCGDRLNNSPLYLDILKHSRRKAYPATRLSQPTPISRIAYL